MRLTANRLRCLRGGRIVFNDLDFALASGEALAVTGPNGAGKSSLLRLVAGLLRPAGGSITLEGGAPDATLPEQAHYLGHVDAMKPALTVAENLAFWSAYLGGAEAGSERGIASDAAALADVGLAELAELPAAYLSAGQRRRLSIARLVAAPRALWLLDEPTSALDAESQQRFASLMRRHLQGGGMILAATHGPLGIAARELRIGPPVTAALSAAPAGAGL